MKTHGHAVDRTLTRTYRAWKYMKARCTISSATDYRNYGGRGIRVCDEWMNSFEAFLRDMGEAPSPTHSLDRIDVNGDYEPGNCRWATRKQQSRNTRRSYWLTHDGETLTLTDWAERVGLGFYTLKMRLVKLGWSADRALRTPAGPWNRRGK